MKALVYRGPGDKAVEDRPKPALQAPGDAIVKITKTTICGTDLHILKGDVATCAPGRILGHEGVGVIDSVGAGVTAFNPGNRVLISFSSSCGKCEYCRRGMYSHCTTGGWILGNEIDGTQAEYVRIPYADTSLYPIPEGADEEALVMLSDILPTGFECGVLNGKVAPGSTVAIVGAGPIGLAAMLTAQFYSPAEIIMIDLDGNRLEVARRFGATLTINSADGKAAERVKAVTGVHTMAAGHCLDPLRRLAIRAVDRERRAKTPRDFQPVAVEIDHDDFRRRIELRGEHSGEADRAGADDRHRRAGRHFAIENSAFEAGRQNIAQHDQGFFVRALWDRI